jgi:DNA (cytosine-5)-methyltransferase 1
MKYLSLCSGIEAATVAWHPLGWEAVAYSEIERFPSEVLAHHYPNTPNLGDMTKFKEWTNVSNVDLLVGGTPCQSFSVAGLRKGLDDPRGNLMLTYLAIAKQYRPNWLVWENVPGVLSSNGGRDFGSFLGGLAECGYGFAYRVLDAQYFGVAQRRRRVFVIGYLGDWRLAAAVLFERYSLQGHPAPSREKRQAVAASVGAGAPFSSIENNRVDVINALCAADAKGVGNQYLADHKCVVQPVSYDMKQHHNPQPSDTAQLTTKNCAFVRGDTPLVQPIPIHDQATRHAGKNGEKTMGKGNGLGVGHSGEPMNTLTKGDRHAVAVCLGGQHPNAGIGIDQSTTLTEAMGAGGGHIPITFGFDAYNQTIQGQVNQPLRVSSAPGQVDAIGGIVQGMAVRRLTPVECERLQGFSDNYTDIKSKNKPTPDGPRYKALGNSMAVPVMAWIGQRIEQVEAICQHNK